MGVGFVGMKRLLLVFLHSEEFLKTLAGKNMETQRVEEVTIASLLGHMMNLEVMLFKQQRSQEIS